MLTFELVTMKEKHTITQNFTEIDAYIEIATNLNSLYNIKS